MLDNEKALENCVDLKTNVVSNSLKDSNVKSRMKQQQKKVGQCSLTCSISRIEGCARILGQTHKRKFQMRSIYTTFKKKQLL